MRLEVLCTVGEEKGDSEQGEATKAGKSIKDQLTFFFGVNISLMRVETFPGVFVSAFVGVSAPTSLAGAPSGAARSGDAGGVNTCMPALFARCAVGVPVQPFDAERNLDFGVAGSVPELGDAGTCCLASTRSSSSRAARWYSCHCSTRLIRSSVSQVAIASRGTDMVRRAEWEGWWREVWVGLLWDRQHRYLVCAYGVVVRG